MMTFFNFKIDRQCYGLFEGCRGGKIVRRLPLFIEVVLLGRSFVDNSAIIRKAKFDIFLICIEFKELFHRNTYLKTLIA